MRKATLWFLVIGLLLGLLDTAVAQDGGRVVITPAEIDEFPEIGFYLEAYDASGNIIVDMTPDEVQVLENGAVRSVDELERIEPGIQMTVAVNGSPMLNNQIAGVTHYEKIQEALQAWAERQPALAPDDFSLSTNTGLQAIRLHEPDEWVKAITDYQPDFMELQPGLISLTQAVDMATDPNPHPRMKRAILYITPLPITTTQSALPDLAENATQLGVRIFIWLVAPVSSANSPEAQSLLQLATSTGGQLFLFSGAEELPDLDVYLYQLRYQYKVHYTSAINQSGSQQLAVRINRGGFEVTSERQVFDLNVLPPNPMFLSPPIEIMRTWSEDTEGKGESALEPETITIPILIEFPDGYSRPLVRSRLFVDGNLVAENTELPFDQFKWTLIGYDSSGSHNLQVEVEDVLGLNASSIETVVNVIVEPLKTNMLSELTSGRRLTIGAAMLGAALVVLLVLLLARRRSLRVWGNMWNRRAYKDPVTQPVSIRQEQGIKTVTANQKSPTIQQQLTEMMAPARLVRLSEDGHPVASEAIPLDRSEINFGSDPKQVTYKLDSPSVDDLHAHMTKTAEGKYVLSDSGSIAGTWINYSPVSATGVELKHGDIVHIGREAFRFEMRNPTRVRKPVVTSYKEEGYP